MVREIAYREPFSTKKSLRDVFREVDKILEEHPNYIFITDGDAQEFRVYKR